MKIRTLVILAIAAIVAGLIYFQTTRKNPVEVVLVNVERGEVIASVSNTRAGTVNTCNRARISPMYSGQINTLNVRPGDKVKQGQVLLTLWNQDVEAQLRLSIEEKKVAIARADEMCAASRVASSEADRIGVLVEQKMISDERADFIVGEARAKVAGCRAMRYLIDVSTAKIEIAEAHLEQTKLRAPFDGTVAEVNGEVGEIVTASPVGVATLPAVDLIDDSCTYVKAPIDEVDAPDIRAGMPARISLDAFSDKTFPGTVKRVAPYVLDLEKQARTVEIEVEFDQPSEELLPGYSADVEVILDTRQDVLQIPTQALKRGSTVMTIDSTGILVEQPVETGLSNWQVTEITGGLSEGQSIVLSIDRQGVEAGAAAVATKE